MGNIGVAQDRNKILWEGLNDGIVSTDPKVENCLLIRYFLMLVTTGSFSPERGLSVIFCVDFNHFKSIIMSALLHRKTLICSFLNQFRLLFICYQRKFNLLKPSLLICHSNMIRMYRKMDRKSVFTHAATW